jgi:hypothetical protein
MALNLHGLNCCGLEPRHTRLISVELAHNGSLPEQEVRSKAMKYELEAIIFESSITTACTHCH